MAILLRSPLPPWQAHALPLIGTFLLGFAFSVVWPGRSLLWGLWVSSAYWIYFTVVFIALVLAGDTDWAVLLEAAATLCFGWLGALLGRTPRAIRAKHVPVVGA
jgi:hypothetical protein